MLEIDLEAKMLARYTGIKRGACKKWMVSAGINSVTDLIKRYPGVDRTGCIKMRVER